VTYEEVVQSRGTVQFSFGEVPAYAFEESVVWGITYNILSEFIEAIGTT
jgi:hypothetical protein